MSKVSAIYFVHAVQICGSMRETVILNMQKEVISITEMSDKFVLETISSTVPVVCIPKQNVKYYVPIPEEKKVK